MDFSSYNKDECFTYSVVSEKMLGTLYKVRKKIPITKIDRKHIKKGQEILNLIVDGKLVESGKKDVNSLTGNNLFIYDYGSTAINSFINLSKSEEVLTYLRSLIRILNDVENSNADEIELVEDFFDTVGELLDKEIEESKYIIHNNHNLTSNWYM